MDKNEILEKSRIENENGDERQQIGIKNAGNISVIVASTLCVIFAFIRLFILHEDVFDLTCILFSINSTNYIIQYIYLKKKSYLLLSIIGILAAALQFIAFVLDLIG